jgi:hypothetical protein
LFLAIKDPTAQPKTKAIRKLKIAEPGPLPFLFISSIVPHAGIKLLESELAEYGET